MTEGTTATSVDYAARRRQRAMERRLERRRRLPLAVAITLAVGVVVAVLAEAAFTVGRIHPGVTVAGVPVGGMTSAQAGAALEAALPGIVERPVTVTFQGTEWRIDAADVGVSFDMEEHVRAAMGVGRKGGLLRAAGQRVRAWVRGVDVPVRPDAHPARMEDVLARVAKGIDVPPTDATVVVDGEKLTVRPARDGRALARDRAGRMVLAAMVSGSRTVQAPVKTVHPAVSDDDAEAAKAKAAMMIGAEVTIAHAKKRWEFSPRDIAGWLAFERSDRLEGQDGSRSAPVPGSIGSDDEVTLIPVVSAEKVRRSVMPVVGARVGRPPKDARFSTANGRVTIIPSEEGIGPDIDTLAAELTVELADPKADRVVELQTTRAEPELTTAEAEAMGVRERLSRFTTTYDPDNVARVNNIHLLGDALDGKLVPPGGTFSFNEAVGERTAAKGYKEANAIVNGKLVPQLGGGICQVGTTLFNAVFESGLPVLERRNHSFYISHYPDGRDATVSWGGPDLKFKNDTKHWVLVSVSYTSSSITIALYGTDPGYDVQAEKGPWTDFRDYPVEEVKDPTLAKGKRIIEDKGIRGRRITVTRTVYLNGEVVRTDRFVSVYKPKVEVVRVGTKPVPAPGSSAPTATPRP